jgi:hypothetical protein
MTPSDSAPEVPRPPFMAHLRRALTALSRAIGEILSGPGATGRIIP